MKNMHNDIPRPNSTSSTIKLLQIATAIAGIWLLLQTFVLTQEQGRAIIQTQNSQLTREMLYTISHTAAYLIENDQLDGLKQLTQHIASSQYLHDVVVYDANGVRMSWSKESEPARLLYSPFHREKLQAMVQPIMKNQQLLGYIKLSLRQDALLSPTEKPWHNLMQQIMLMMLLAGFVGFMLRRGFSRLSRQSIRLKKSN